MPRNCTVRGAEILVPNLDSFPKDADLDLSDGPKLLACANCDELAYFFSLQKTSLGNGTAGNESVPDRAAKRAHVKQGLESRPSSLGSE